MRGDELETQDAAEGQYDAEPQDTSDDYVAPKLTHLGSFEELTRNGVGAVVDAEGQS